MSPSAQEESQRPALVSARQYRWLALIYAAVTVFASLVPLHFRFVRLELALRHFGKVCARPINFRSPADWLVNILLFIPLGYLLTAAFTVGRRRITWLVAVAVVAGCAILSAAIEFAQIYFPPRICSFNDVVAETLGAAFGALLWSAVGQPLTAWARGGKFGTGLFPVELFPCCLLVLTLVQLLPLDLSVQPEELSQKYRQGGFRLAYFIPWPGIDNLALRELPHIFLFLPIGVLLSGLGASRWREWAGWRPVLGLGLLIVGSIKFLQLFVLSRDSFACDVFAGGLSILLGWALGTAVHKFSAGRQPLETVVVWKRRRRYFLAALVGWIAALVFLNWYPFNFIPDMSWAANRLAQVSYIPLTDYWEGDYLQAMNQVVSRLALYFPVGLVLPPALGWETKGRTGIRVVLTVALAAIVVEIGQAFLPSRYPSMTDVLVETLGAWFGYLCFRQLRFAAIHSMSTANFR